MSFLVFIIRFSFLDKVKSPDNNQKNNWYNRASLVMPALLEKWEGKSMRVDFVTRSSWNLIDIWFMILIYVNMSGGRQVILC